MENNNLKISSPLENLKNKASWRDKFYDENHHVINDLKNRVDPLSRAIQFCQLYHPKRDLNHSLTEKQMIQLIMQYLDFSGLQGTLQTLEKESDQNCDFFFLLKRLT